MQRIRGEAGQIASCYFQYPRSDRRRCNIEVNRTHVRIEHPFSILGRIGGDATRYINSLSWRK